MLVSPTKILPHVCDIDLDELYAMGIRGFIFDLDNTIMAPKAGVLDDTVKAWLHKVSDMGFQRIVVSNNKRTFYIQQVSEVLDFPVIGNAGKPWQSYLKKAVEVMALEPSQIVVVGDRPLTDILGGHWLGAHTILVDPLTKATEKPVIKVLRKLEALFVKSSVKASAIKSS